MLLRLFYVFAIGFLSMAHGKEKFSIGIVGTGYMGLVTGAYFAKIGHEVLCIDNDQTKMQMLSSGNVPFYEPGLQELLTEQISLGNLHFCSSIEKLVDQSLIIFICVGTPASEDGSPDLSYLYQATESIAKHLKEHRLIVVKSTVPPGTCRSLHERMSLFSSGVSFDVASNPEFLREGSAVANMFYPDRIIVGSNSQQAENLLRALYQDQIDSSHLLLMNTESAELTKQASNAMLASRISFMNEISRICDKTGANIHHVKEALSLDNRIGKSFLDAGIGFGGSCFPKDLKALAHFAKKNHVETPLISAIYETNELQKKVVINKIIRHLKSLQTNNPSVGIWGLSFKPGTDDIRDAPAAFVIDELCRHGYRVKVYDPIALNSPAALKLKSRHENLFFAKDEYDAAADVDILALVTEWPQFAKVDMAKVSQIMRGNLFLDGRNQFSLVEMQKRGFDYIGVGISTLENLIR